MKITFTVGNLGKRETIYSALKARLGREPHHQELVADVARILSAERARPAEQFNIRDGFVGAFGE